MPPADTDFTPAETRALLRRAADLAADYLERVESLPVLPSVAPGDLLARLPATAPEDPEPIDDILADVETLIEPGLTHWNHPGFLAYFASPAPAPGILGEMLAAALNVNAMLWRTSPPRPSWRSAPSTGCGSSSGSPRASGAPSTTPPRSPP
jgi:aromatic-L-amino-acid/L-tryptophan decarboxylase